VAGQLDLDHYPDNLLARVADLERRLKDVERNATRSRVLVGCDYNQAIPDATLTQIEYNYGLLDERGEWDMTTWEFTADLAGSYHVCASILLNATTLFGGAEAARLSLVVNDSEDYRLDRKDQLDVFADTTYVMLSGSLTIPLEAGDRVHAAVYQNQGAATSLYPGVAYNHLSITRVA